MLIPLIFENNNFIVIEKPANLSFHSEDGAGLVVRAAQQFALELFSVHRLDKITSGLLILAKNSQTAQAFSILFEDKKIEKYYLAISMRKPRKKQGWIKGDMAQARRGNYKLLPTFNNPAITQFISTALEEHERLFLVKPHTGKTHQIRVALKSIGAPAGDSRYAHANIAKLEDRAYLHAYALRFSLHNENFSFVSIPELGTRFKSTVFKEKLARWSKPWELFQT